MEEARLSVMNAERNPFDRRTSSPSSPKLSAGGQRGTVKGCGLLGSRLEPERGAVHESMPNPKPASASRPPTPLYRSLRETRRPEEATKGD
ncbi:hypothetical protein MRX96_043242 [Rhipicephalus microplus]